MSTKTFIELPQGEWLDVSKSPYPDDDNAYPFWATIQHGSLRQISLVVMTTDDGLCHTNDYRGEHYDGPVEDLVTHWMPQRRPLFPAKFN